MAHVQKRGDRWQARYRAPDGRERSARFDRKVDAERWLATNGADIARGAWIDPAAGKVSFREFASIWLGTKADVSDRTRINVEGRLTNHALPVIGHMSMRSIRPSDIRVLVAGLTAAGKAPSTVKAVYLTVSQVFAQAVLDGIIAKTPCAGIALPRERHTEMHFITPGQVNDLADAIDDRYRALVYTAAYGGLRAGELVALRLSNLDVLGGTLRVTGAAREVRGELRFGPTKTGTNRTVALPRFLAQMLGEHVGRYPSDQGFVFTAAEGGPIRHRNFYRRHFRPAVEKAQSVALDQARDEEALPGDLRWHDLRHTAAALLIANGRHMEEVKDHLGHSSIRVTSDRYGHLFPAARRALADSLDETFQRASETAFASAHADKARTRGRIVAFPDAEQGAS
ncbi:MAG: tyrosine-type recombinase/integrase [Acidimicrobiales bacterium]